MRHPRLILAIFILSGAAGLIYEVVWSRQLVLVFGNTTQAVSAILTGFFGGMAIGGVVGGRIADRVRSPLRLYGVIELVLVVVVLATPITFRLLHELYRGAYAALEGSAELLALAAVRAGAAGPGPGDGADGRDAADPDAPSHARRSTCARRSGGCTPRTPSARSSGRSLAGLVLIELFGLTGHAARRGGLLRGSPASIALLPVRDRTSGDRRARPPAGDPAEVDRRPATPDRTSATLALVVAFVSGLTSLGYQVLWTRLLASGTGNSTYVFTMILGTFLIGIAIGARRCSPAPAADRQTRSRLLAAAQVPSRSSRRRARPRHRPARTARSRRSRSSALWRSSWPVAPGRPAGDDRHGPQRSRPRRRCSATRRGASRANAGQLLAANTFGAIVGTFVIPFVVIPASGRRPPSRSSRSSTSRLGVALARRAAAAAGRARRASRGAGGRRRPSSSSRSRARRGRRPERGAAIARGGGTVFASGGGRDRVRPGRARRRRQQLWVTGTSMTLLTVDAKLMPILPLMLRPDSKRALTVAFGMGSAFRAALIAGLETDAVELVPSVPKMFGYFYPDADEVLADPNGRLIVADGRNHVELTDRRYDIIVTDPPPPIESSGASVISSLEYYRGRPRPAEPGRRDDAVDAVRLDGRRVPGPRADVPGGLPARPDRRSGRVATASSCSARTSR